MRFSKFITLASLVALLLISAPFASAKSDTAPKAPPALLLIGANNGQDLYEGDVWAWDGSRVIKLTINGHNYLPLLSPAMTTFAYQQVSPAFVTARTANPDLGNNNVESPTDIFLWDLKTTNPTRIATQPSKPLFTTDNTARYTLRSEPSWSPDGKFLAWTEVAVDGATNADMSDERLVVYDMAAKTTKTLIDPLPAHQVATSYGPLMSSVALGPNGLIALSVYPPPQKQDDKQFVSLYFYDQTGKQLSEADQVDATDEAYHQSQLIWLTGEAKPSLSCVACMTQVDPQTGAVTDLGGTPEMYSPLAPDKLSMYYGADSGDESNVTWIIAMNGKQVSTFNSVRLNNVTDGAISPDGMHVAAANFAGQGSTAGVFMYGAQSGKTTSITINVTGLGWGPVAWRIRPNPPG